jgi:hypothetical protein
LSDNKEFPRNSIEFDRPFTIDTSKINKAVMDIKMNQLIYDMGTVYIEPKFESHEHHEAVKELAEAILEKITSLHQLPEPTLNMSQDIPYLYRTSRENHFITFGRTGSGMSYSPFNKMMFSQLVNQFIQVTSSCGTGIYRCKTQWDVHNFIELTVVVDHSHSVYLNKVPEKAEHYCNIIEAMEKCDLPTNGTLTWCFNPKNGHDSYILTEKLSQGGDDSVNSLYVIINSLYPIHAYLKLKRMIEGEKKEMGYK